MLLRVGMFWSFVVLVVLLFILVFADGSSVLLMCSLQFEISILFVFVVVFFWGGGLLMMAWAAISAETIFGGFLDFSI